jgi:hypothetical protein
VEFADGSREGAPRTGPVLVEILGRDTVEEAVIFGDDVRIGYTVLAKLDLHADHANCCLIPNPAHPDGPVSKVK